MSLRYSGPATLRTDSGRVDVQAVLATNTSDGTYSWGGRLTTLDLAALKTERKGGTLTLSMPGAPSADVHVVVADPDPNGGVVLRVHGHGRAPYETPDDRTAIDQEHAEEAR